MPPERTNIATRYGVSPFQFEMDAFWGYRGSSPPPPEREAFSMGAKCILRVQKLKSAQSVKRSLMHGFREQETPNADPSKRSLNFFAGAQNATEAYQRFKSCLPEKKQRRDAVQCLEFLFTGSPEWFTENSESRHKQYFSDSLDWLKSKFGARNVFFAGIHRDETTPHMYAYVVPKNEETGNLSAAKWLGHAGALSEMQTNFAEVVGVPNGLERGLKGSKAKHKSIQKYYAEINQAMDSEPPKAPTRVDFAQAAAGVKNERIERLIALASMVPQMSSQVKRIKSGYGKIQRLQEQLDERAEKLGSIEKAESELNSKAMRVYKQADRLTEALSANEKYRDEVEQLKIALRRSQEQLEIEREFRNARSSEFKPR